MKTITRSILRLPKRSKQSHKGDFGKVLVVAGSEDYPGAAGLCALAALAVMKTGTDLVTVAAPEHVAWVLNAVSFSLITKKMKGRYFQQKHAKEIIRLMDKNDVMLIGPGVGRKSDSFVNIVCKKVKKWKVIDADAIKALRKTKVQNAIFTPHSKEFEMLTGKTLPEKTQQRAKIMQQAAGENIMLFKSDPDIIATKKSVAINRTGNPSMTKGGTGDVLAGFTAGFLALTKDPFQAACMAAYLNGAIGDYLYKQYGNTWLSEDLIHHVQRIYK